MFKQYFQQGEVYLGAGIGPKILKELQQAKVRVIIVSSDISASVGINLLKQAKARGCEVSLILREPLKDDISQQQAYRRLYGQKIHPLKYRPVIKKMLYALIGLLFLANILLSGYLIFIKLQLLMGVFSFCFSCLWLVFLPKIKEISIEKITYHSFVRMFVVRRYIQVEEKQEQLNINANLFLIDDKVYLGSANFTNTAFNDNYECTVCIKDEAIIQTICKELSTLMRLKPECYVENEQIIKWILAVKKSDEPLEHSLLQSEPLKKKDSIWKSWIKRVKEEVVKSE